MLEINNTVAENLSVVLFFTRGVSLRYWAETGLLEREVAIYRRLQSLGVRVTFVTYGDSTDLDYQHRIKGINICCNRWNLPYPLYVKFIPWLHRKALKSADLIKTNQTHGADIALGAARYWHKPLLARCGYMWSKNVAHEYGNDSKRASESLAVEEKVFCSADFIAVTTSSMCSSLRERFPGVDNKVAIIPNYVDTELFTPACNETSTRAHLCFVGRLEQEKNIEALIEAVEDLEVELEIIGCGTLRDKLATLISDNSKIRLVGTVPNIQLPDHFHNCSLFILPSLYEGHPKALLEAMACGLPVIGTNVSGINEIVKHGETGWLCKTDADSIRQAIQDVLADSALQQRLGSNARWHVVNNYALDRVVAMELEAYHITIGRGARAAC